MTEGWNPHRRLASARVNRTQDRSSALRQRNRLVVVLAVVSGATDAVGFLALGSTFTSVMTGNLVLLGVGVADRDASAMLLVCVAVVSFILGAAAGARLAGAPREDDAVWPRAVSVALGVELVLFGGFSVGWWLTGGDPGTVPVSVMLALLAGALGLQSSAIQRFGVAGLSTTYLTGTLTSVVINLTRGRGLRSVRHPLVILLGLVLGAALATVLLHVAPVTIPLVQVVAVGGTLLVVLLHRSLRVS